MFLYGSSLTKSYIYTDTGQILCQRNGSQAAAEYFYVTDGTLYAANRSLRHQHQIPCQSAVSIKTALFQAKIEIFRPVFNLLSTIDYFRLPSPVFRLTLLMGMKSPRGRRQHLRRKLAFKSSACRAHKASRKIRLTCPAPKKSALISVNPWLILLCVLSELCGEKIRVNLC